MIHNPYYLFLNPLFPIPCNVHMPSTKISPPYLNPLRNLYMIQMHYHQPFIELTFFCFFIIFNIHPRSHFSNGSKDFIM